jgi:hypothetical protein
MVPSKNNVFVLNGKQWAELKEQNEREEKVMKQAYRR